MASIQGSILTRSYGYKYNVTIDQRSLIMDSYNKAKLAPNGYIYWDNGGVWTRKTAGKIAHKNFGIMKYM